MYEYIFLFVIGFLWILFATIQDLKTREIANWITFSLIMFGLAYRAFFSVISGNQQFFLLGVGATLLFASLAYLFYYGKVFAGGDAKLLIGVGALLPIERFYDYLYVGGGFIIALFACGAVYTLIYSSVLVKRNYSVFINHWKKEFYHYRIWLIPSFVVAIAAIIFLSDTYTLLVIVWACTVAVLPLFYMYARALESACMLKRTDVRKLTEGDWLVHDITVSGRTIRKSVHGLTKQDITFLRKHTKNVLIREGIPFAPAFLLAFLLMAPFFF